MSSAVSLAEVLARGVTIDAHEAIAIVQELIGRAGPVAVTPPLGPPVLENVCLGSKGSVLCRGCDATPAVSEIAMLLDSILQRSGESQIKMPGGLRYAIARALLVVDVPPFDSLADFSETLARYERGPRTVLLRALYERYTATIHRTTPQPFRERRRTTAASAELRRRLREADEERFYLLRAAPAASPLVAATGPAAEHPRAIDAPASNAEHLRFADAPSAAEPRRFVDASMTEHVRPLDAPLTWSRTDRADRIASMACSRDRSRRPGGASGVRRWLCDHAPHGRPADRCGDVHR